MWFELVLIPILQALIPIVALGLSGLAAAVLTKVYKKLGVDLEAKDRETFQSAIVSASKVAVSKMGGPAATDYISDTVLDEAVKIVKESAPDAIKRFNIDAAEIKPRVKAQAEIIVQSTPTTLERVGDIAETIFERVVIPIAANSLINVVRRK